MADKDPKETKQPTLSGGADAKRKTLTADQWNDIKLGKLNSKTGDREGGLMDAEHNTAQGWHKMVDAMLGHIGKDVPEDFVARHKEITAMLAGATNRRKPVPHGYGAWFMALVDLFEVAKAPDGAERPTEEEILNAREPSDIRKELADRYNQRAIGGGGQKDEPDSIAAAERSEVV